MAKFSIIVPVYNTDKFLQRCIDSILSQSFTDFELIVVDDGSTDTSASICDSYVEKDSRIKVFHRKNYGLGETRRFGIEQSNGEYIWHVDSDDWIAGSALEVLNKAIEGKRYDIVSFNFLGHYPAETLKIDASCNNHEVLFRQIIASDWGTIWKLIAKRSLYTNNKIFYACGQTGGEDYIVVSQLMYYAKNSVCIKDYLYHYNMLNDSSFMSSTNTAKIFEQIRATSIVENFLLEHNVANKYQEELNKRKLWSKEPLRTTDFKLWKKVFPEVNRIEYDKYRGVRAFIRKNLRQLADILYKI